VFHRILEQVSKIGTQMDAIDWNIMGKIWRNMTTRHQIWMTKWAMGWLVTGNNMKKWKLWSSDQYQYAQFPRQAKLLSTYWIVLTLRQLIIHKKSSSLEEFNDLTKIGFPIQDLPMVIFQFSYCTKLPTREIQVLMAQQTIGHKCTVQWLISKQWQGIGPLCTNASINNNSGCNLQLLIFGIWHGRYGNIAMRLYTKPWSVVITQCHSRKYNASIAKVSICSHQAITTGWLATCMSCYNSQHHIVEVGSRCIQAMQHQEQGTWQPTALKLFCTKS